MEARPTRSQVAAARLQAAVSRRRNEPVDPFIDRLANVRLTDAQRPKESEPAGEPGTPGKRCVP